MALPVAALSAAGIHLVAGLLAYGAAALFTADQSAIAPAALERIIDSPQQIQFYRADIRQELAKGALLSLFASFGFAAVWLLLAFRARPAGDAQARALRPHWAGLFLLAIVAAGIICWQLVLDARVAPLMAAGVGLNHLLVTVGLTAIAYWLSTAALAPRVVRVSVPLADHVFGR
jgi:hypothetical protein